MAPIQHGSLVYDATECNLQVGNEVSAHHSVRIRAMPRRSRKHGEKATRPVVKVLA